VHWVTTNGGKTFHARRPKMILSGIKMHPHLPDCILASRLNDRCLGTSQAPFPLPSFPPFSLSPAALPCVSAPPRPVHPASALSRAWTCRGAARMERGCAILARGARRCAGAGARQVGK
jgi:hypothetical protein